MNSIRLPETHPSVFVVLFLFLFLSFTIPLTTARADGSSAPTFSLSTGILNQYIFRGVANSDSSAVIEPSFTASWEGFSANVWGNVDTSRNSDNPFLPMPAFETGNAKWSETDVTFSYTKNLTQNFSVLIGNVYYGVERPLQSPYGTNEDEVFGGVSYNFPWFTAAFTTYGEVMNTVDEWFELDLSKSIPLPMLNCVCKGTTLNLGTSFGYLILNHTNNLLALNGSTGSYSGPQTCLLDATVAFPINKYLTLAPTIGLWLPLTSAAANYLEANSLDEKATHFYGGINMTATF